MTQGANLIVRDLCKSYGAQPVVKDFNLVAERGEFISLLGPSGCGKTTTLRMIAGLVEPGSGGIFLDGEDITWKPVHQRNFGLLFQSYALFPHLNVYENIAFGLRQRRMKEADIRLRVDNALEQVMLPGVGKRFSSQLSGGQQQRVALARAIVIEPSVLLLDEPLSNLDALLRNQMQIELKRLQAQLGITTILVTHDQSEAMTMSDRVVVLREGSLEQVGTPEEIYRSPATPFVRQFVGRTNFLPAKVREVGERSVRVVLEGGAEVLASLPSTGRRSSAGDEVQVTLRHEQPRLARLPTPQAENSLAAKVLIRAFAGPLIHYMVQLENNGPELHIEMQSSDDSYPVGASVHVEWAVDDAVITTNARPPE